MAVVCLERVGGGICRCGFDFCGFIKLCFRFLYFRLFFFEDIDDIVKSIVLESRFCEYFVLIV